MTQKEKKKHRELPCLACGSTPTDIAHIRSRGSGGKDELFNIIPLCRRDHISQHRLGWYSFARGFPYVMRSLKEKGWEFVGFKIRRCEFDSDSVLTHK